MGVILVMLERIKLHYRHSGSICAPHIGVHRVADVERARGIGAQRGERRRKDPRIRLGNSEDARVHDRGDFRQCTGPHLAQLKIETLLDRGPVVVGHDGNRSKMRDLGKCAGVLRKGMGPDRSGITPHSLLLAGRRGHAKRRTGEPGGGEKCLVVRFPERGIGLINIIERHRSGDRRHPGVVRTTGAGVVEIQVDAGVAHDG